MKPDEGGTAKVSVLKGFTKEKWVRDSTGVPKIRSGISCDTPSGNTKTTSKIH